jgi:hypothetical protein
MYKWLYDNDFIIFLVSDFVGRFFSYYLNTALEDHSTYTLTVTCVCRVSEQSV